MEVVKVNRRQKIERSGGDVFGLVRWSIPIAKGKQRVVVGRRGAQHGSVGGRSAKRTDLGGTGGFLAPGNKKQATLAKRALE